MNGKTSVHKGDKTGYRSANSICTKRNILTHWAITNSLFLIVLMVIISSSASAINTFLVTGPTKEISHSNHKSAIVEADDELEDYFNDNGQLCEKFVDGLTPAQTIMYFQRHQPQHYITAIHSKDTTTLKAGSGQTEQEMAASQWVSNIKIGGYNWYTPEHPAAPFSSIVILADNSFEKTGGIDYIDVFSGYFGAHVYIGIIGKGSSSDKKAFSDVYTDSVTDDKDSYIKAIRDGRIRTGDDFNAAIKDKTYLGGATSGKDQYYWSKRYEAYEGTILSKGTNNAKTLSYTRAFTGTVRGAFVIFHGLVDGSVDDSDTGTINLYITKVVGGQETFLKSFNYTVQNRQMGNPAEWGGSDICSAWIYGFTLPSNGGTMKVKATLLDSSTCYEYSIERFEVIEHGIR